MPPFVLQLKEGDLRRDEQDTPRMVKLVGDTLESVGGATGINFFRFVINPHSFGQSVENLFYLSFLTHDGIASLEMDDEDDEPILCTSLLTTTFFFLLRLIPLLSLSLFFPFSSSSMRAPNR
jgi:Nse4 C-terminal